MWLSPRYGNLSPLYYNQGPDVFQVNPFTYRDFLWLFLSSLDKNDDHCVGGIYNLRFIYHLD